VSRMRRNQSSRRGYVLVLTLGLITLAAISLTGLARYSLALASSTEDATEELQRRWGLLTIRHVLIERAAEILDAQLAPGQQVGPPWPKPSVVTAKFSLGGQQFEVELADEDAKTNLNILYSQKPDQVSSAIRRLNRGTDGLSVSLRPEQGST